MYKTKCSTSIKIEKYAVWSLQHDESSMYYTIVGLHKVKWCLYERGLENCGLTGIVVLFRRTKMF